ncbi:carcinoembryonic antigen-related cell adhesion molecule 5-like [Sphaeramia orbicularis]|uniref:carcinoembryonic antigen-related cell adhesion molecule 5-like n=1 Tax=Sphaeramia orbicularis TaxID=375764 RepID=UPI00117EF099|nr:carcinoembryonic antigen-related cell adhesion molecule 5-like [Sphaeramia orbicularis]
MEFSSVRLSCSSSGSSPSFHWFNDSSEVTADRVQITDGGSTMTIVNVTRYDQGPFRCSVSNLVSNGTSDPVTFTISYGPYNVKISGPTKLEKGKNLELKCIAESVPYANYTWIRDGERILNNSDMFIKQNVQTSATYTCEAKNSVTGRLAYGEHHLTVKVSPGKSPLYSIGIVVACLLVVSISVGVAYVCIKKKKKNKARSPAGKE